MAHDPMLASRTREILIARNDMEEKKMFGGVAFLIGGHMCCGVLGDDLIVRLGADNDAAALQRPHTRVFDITGRAMKGWLMVAAAGLGSKRDLKAWVDRAVAFVATLPPKN